MTGKTDQPPNPDLPNVQIGRQSAGGWSGDLDEDVFAATLARLRALAHGTSKLAVSVGLERSDDANFILYDTQYTMPELLYSDWVKPAPEVVPLMDLVQKIAP